MARALALLLLVWVCPAWAEGRVLLFRAVGTVNQARLSGRVFRNESGGGHSTFSKNLRNLLQSNWEGVEVEVRFAGQSVKTVSGEGGNFEAVFVPEKGKTFDVGLQVAEAKVSGAAAGAASVDVIDPAAPFFVVSDFDDTLVVTDVLSQRKALSNSLFNDAKSSKVVEGMPGFMKCLRDDKPQSPVFALVSGSPIQYTDRVQDFLALHRFPVFGLYLRDMGPSTLSGYKQPVIRKLLADLPQPVVLVGDSGEKDPEIYAEMKKEFPTRVKAIFIHDVGRSEDKARFKGMTLFKNPGSATDAAVRDGLMSQECADLAFPKEAVKDQKEERKKQ